MTRQEIFDIVATHLIRQRKRCNDGSRCLYRGPNGMKCAVGILIPEEMYDKRMDSIENNVTMLIMKFGNEIPSYFKKHEQFLQSLQKLHDLSINWANIRSTLDDFAKKNHLTIPVVERIDGGIL